MEPAVIDGKHILILWAPGGPARPYKSWVTLGKTHTEWAYYIRKGSNTVRAKGSDERELLGLANNNRLIFQPTRNGDHPLSGGSRCMCVTTSRALMPHSILGWLTLPHLSPKHSKQQRLTLMVTGLATCGNMPLISIRALPLRAWIFKLNEPVERWN